jgi:hypothetical protein
MRVHIKGKYWSVNFQTVRGADLVPKTNSSKKPFTRIIKRYMYIKHTRCTRRSLGLGQPSNATTPLL